MLRKLQDDREKVKMSTMFKSTLSTQEKEARDAIENLFARKKVEVEEDFFTYTCYLYLKKNEKKYLLNSAK